MAIDAFALAIGFREIASSAREKKAFQVNKTHYVHPVETLDPSLTNQFVYGNRADWLVSAAINDFIDVDKPVQTGARRFIALTEAVAITKQAMNVKQKNAMKLY